MRSILGIAAIAVGIFFNSCKLAEPIGSTAGANNLSQGAFIEDVVVGNAVNVIDQSEIAPTYTIEELKEEQLQTTYSVYNISETFKKINKRTENLFNQIEKWYGTPYRYGGTTSKGIDCSAFMQKLYSSLYKYQLPRTSRAQYAASTRVDKSSLQEGDLVFFKIRTSNISHVGLYVGDGKFVHSSSSKGVVISNLSDNYWTRYYAGGGRIESAIYAFNN